MQLFDLEISKVYTLDYFNQVDRADMTSEKIDAYLKERNVPSEILYSDSENELFYNLGLIAGECSQKPILIQFSGHCNETGIGNNIPFGPNKISLSWNQLKPFLSKVQLRSNQQLVLNMLIPCNGYCISIVNHNQDTYFKMFGSISAQSSGISERCINLFKFVLGNRTIHNAIDHLKTSHSTGDYAID